MFAFKRSKFDVIKVMRREAMAPEAYSDVICEHGAPNKTVTNNAEALTGTCWTSISIQFSIEMGLTVPHRQHQNYSEGQGVILNLHFRSSFTTRHMLLYLIGGMQQNSSIKYANTCPRMPWMVILVTR